MQRLIRPSGIGSDDLAIWVSATDTSPDRRRHTADCDNFGEDSTLRVIQPLEGFLKVCDWCQDRIIRSAEKLQAALSYYAEQTCQITFPEVDGCNASTLAIHEMKPDGTRLCNASDPAPWNGHQPVLYRRGPGLVTCLNCKRSREARAA